MNQVLSLSALFLIVLCQFGRSAVQLPYIACPDLFEYQGYNGQYIGMLLIRHDPRVANHTLLLEFCQDGYFELENAGAISVADDQEAQKLNLRNGWPIQYRVDFPMPHLPPKLTSIKLNDEQLCSASNFPKPRTTISLSYTLSSNIVPLAFAGSPITPQRQWESNEPNTFPQRRPLAPVQQPPQRRRLQPTQQPAPPQQQFRPNAVEQTFDSNRQTFTSDRLSDVCGRERLTTTPLIFGGIALEAGQLPWLVGLFEKRTDNGLGFFCGGTLVSRSTVISAAHCFRHPGRDLPASRTAVSMGRNSLDILADGELINVAQLLIHKDYDQNVFVNDIVLIRLDTRVAFTNYIVPICLWNTNYRMELPQGQKSYVAGFGPDGKGNENTDVARVTDTDIVVAPRCRQELPDRLVQPNTVCAKKVGSGPCSTDAGGGLMVRENGIWVLRGIVVGGAINVEEHTCDLNKPVVYTDVAKHNDWVRENMWD